MPLAGRHFAGARHRELIGGDDQADEEREQHEPQPAIDGLALRLRQQADERGDARMLGVAQAPRCRRRTSARRAAGARSPRSMESAVQDVAADDLQAHDGSLRDDEHRDRPVQQAVARR